MPVIDCDADAAASRLADAGVTIGEGNTAHERWRAEDEGAIAVAYDGKVVIQGKRPHSLAALVRGSEDGENRGASGRTYCYFDGASWGNPGPAAIGWVLVTDDGIVAEGGERVGRATNNQAEYEALTRALEVARDYGFEEVDVRGDSELIVKQVRGEYDANDPELREHRVTVSEGNTDHERWRAERGDATAVAYDGKVVIQGSNPADLEALLRE